MSQTTLAALVAGIKAAKLPPVSMRRPIREDAGVSLREGADVLGVEVMTLRRWESGESEPQRENAIRYREFLDALRQAIA